MAKFEGLTESIDDVSQEIDLEKYLGKAVQYAPEVKESIAQDIIDLILGRTEQGYDRDYKKLKSPYSDSYAKSLAFKVAGKSKNEVNMKLFGDMLGSLDLIKETRTKITIGFRDQDQIPKAYNHNVGDTLPKRPFFGVSNSDIEEIVEPYKDMIDSIDIQELKIASKNQSSSGQKTSLDDLDLDSFDELFKNAFSVED